MNHNSGSMYKNLFFMATVSFVSMYILMYIMVNRYTNVYSNLNQFYMAGVMTGSMVLIELLIMQGMYLNKKLNAVIIVSSLILTIACLLGVRKQIAIYDKQFLKSMIPHHAAALLMCDQATLHDPEIIELCKKITAGQQSEIDFMKAKLEALR